MTFCGRLDDMIAAGRLTDEDVTIGCETVSPVLILTTRDPDVADLIETIPGVLCVNEALT